MHALRAVNPDAKAVNMPKDNVEKRPLKEPQTKGWSDFKEVLFEDMPPHRYCHIVRKQGYG